jgi:hypothetical protein
MLREGLFFALFFSVEQVLTQGFTLRKQVLYHLSHTSTPFCSGCFGDGVSGITCLG